MMESTEPRSISIKFIYLIGILLSFHSCHGSKQDKRTLECLLESIEIEEGDMDILVGQHNGWSDTTALIIITYHKKSMNLPMNSELKGRYNGKDIYFYHTNIDSLDNKEYEQIPNGIKWKNNSGDIQYASKEIQPPYDPISVQAEYNLKRDCIGPIIKGKGYMANDFESKCLMCVE